MSNASLHLAPPPTLNPIELEGGVRHDSLCKDVLVT